MTEAVPTDILNKRETICSHKASVSCAKFNREDVACVIGTRREPPL